MSPSKRTKPGRASQRPSKRTRGSDNGKRAAQPERPESTVDVLRARLFVNPGGFAFATPLDGQRSVFIPPGKHGGALDGDEVLVSHWDAEKGPMGQVRSVVTRKRTRITGVVRKIAKGRAVVEPDDPRVLGNAMLLGGVPRSAEGQVIVAAIVDYPDPWNEGMTVQLERVLGEPGLLATEEMKILIEHGIRTEFPEEVLEEVSEAPTRLRAQDRELRADLRELDFMTIDPHDARDFDDAVCVEVLGDREEDPYRIHIAVADVSHYVREGTAVDAEAAVRCFSTYLPDRAVPMLPEALSSDICSLVPRKDRLAMVVTLEVTRDGKAGDATVRAAVIRSRIRLTYEEVAAELSGEAKLPAAIRERVILLRSAADRLRRQRLRRGAVELNLPEPKVVLDEDDPTRIRKVYSVRASRWVTQAYNLIEEFMLAANEGVARLAVKHKLPVIFRVHDHPDEGKLERFAAASAMFGVDVDPGTLVSPRGVRSYLKKVADHPKVDSLHGLLLRSMAQAEYETVNVGHFALASTAYLHFTSPIRRYPDLITHRVIKAFLAGRGSESGDRLPMPRLRDSQQHAAHSSERERASTQAERDARNLFAAAYMRDRIGDRLPGRIMGLSESGIFVTLDDPFVDGMIRRAPMEKENRVRYELDEHSIRLVAPKSGHTLALGDRLIVEVIDASLVRRQIDFALISKVS